MMDDFRPQQHISPYEPEAVSWNSLRAYFDKVLEDIHWNQISDEERRHLFLEYTSVAKCDPSRFIAQYSTIICAIAYKTVFELTKAQAKQGKYSMKDISDASQATLSKLITQPKTFAKYDPHWAPSTFLQPHIKPLIVESLTEKTIKKEHDAIAREIDRIQKISIAETGHRVSPVALYTLCESRMPQKVSLMHVLDIVNEGAVVNINDVDSAPDSTDRYTDVESDMLYSTACEHIERTYGTEALGYVEWFLSLSDDEKEQYRKEKDEQYQKAIDSLKLMQSDHVLLKILNAEQRFRHNRTVVNLKLGNGKISDQEFDALANAEFTDMDSEPS